MRDIDIVVGQKYRVVDTSYDYLKKGAIVKILRESVKVFSLHRIYLKIRNLTE